MSETRRVSMFGDMEPKDTSGYIRETKRVCPTCGKKNMFVKVEDASTITLECPNCDLIEHLPVGFEGPPVPAPMNSGAKGGKKK